MRTITTFALLALFALAPSASAVDGVIEINQAAALAGGVTPGDTPGFPVTLSQSGSYRLTGNLSVTNPNSDGIEVLSSNVSIDLNGFEIAGPVTCTGMGSGVSCGAGSGRGINELFNLRGLSIRNGSIRGFGSNAVSAGDQAVIRDAIATGCGDGIGVGGGSVVSSVTVSRVGGNGIWAYSGSLVEKSTSSSNKAVGIVLADFSADGSSSVVGCSANDNGTRGIEASAGSVIREVNVSVNEGTGIVSGAGSLVSSSSVHQNGGRGIEVGTGSTVSGNTILGNAGDGIYLTSGGLVSGNAVHNNTGDGIESGTGRSTVVNNNVVNNSGFGFRGAGSIDDSLGMNNFDGNSAINAIAIGCNTTNSVNYCPPHTP